MRDPLAPPPLVVQTFKPIANYLGLRTLPLHGHEVILGFALYEVLFKIISPAFSRYFFPKVYGELNKRTRINWDSRVTSQVQQAIVSHLAIQIMRPGGLPEQ